jgi:hypothetical protein
MGASAGPRLERFRTLTERTQLASMLERVISHAKERA